MDRLDTETQRTDWRRTTWVPVLIALLLVTIAGIYIDRQSRSLAEQRARAEVQAQLSLIRAKLEGNIASDIQLVRGLVSTISIQPDMSPEYFQDLATRLFEEPSQLRSISVAPGLVITMTYPPENGRNIGLDYRDVPRQWEAVKEVVDTGRLVLAGPIDLVQGGRGFVARFPVYVGQGENRTFW